MVPVSLAVARRLPSLLRLMQLRGDRCASMTFTALSVMASNTSTSPDVGETYVDRGGAWAGLLSPASSRGFGGGEARKQFSVGGGGVQVAGAVGHGGSGVA